MEDEREVIITGTKADLLSMLAAAIDQLQGGDAALYVKGNGGPDLALRFSPEEQEQGEPTVDWYAN